MRRALASILLVLFSLQLIAPVLSASAASDLPACCRRGGKHRCSTQETSGSGPAWKVLQSKCPLYTGVVAFPAYSNTILRGNIAADKDAPYSFTLTLAGPDAPRPHTALPGSVRKRGPPSIAI